jgi:enoyl-[acyl-carrier protein] reductase II
VTAGTSASTSTGSLDPVDGVDAVDPLDPVDAPDAVDPLDPVDAPDAVVASRRPLATRLTALLGIAHPIVQAGMSWASSSAALPLAVSAAGGLGVIAAGPMYPEDLRQAIRTVRAGTRNPFAVNVPLNGKRAAALLDVVFEERVPVVVGAQGGPRGHVARFRAAGVKWIHVTAHPEHARKAEAAGVDAVVAVGAEAGGHPGPDEIGTLVLVRATVRAVSIPVIAAGGIGDGAGIAAMLVLGAEGAALGTRFMLTSEANLHDAYKRVLLAAGVDATTLVGRGRAPLRVLRNGFTRAVEEAIAGRAGDAALLAERSLRQAAQDGDVENGKVEAGQCVGLVGEMRPAADVMRDLVEEACAALRRSGGLACR